MYSVARFTCKIALSKSPILWEKLGLAQKKAEIKAYFERNREERVLLLSKTINWRNAVITKDNYHLIGRSVGASASSAANCPGPYAINGKKSANTTVHQAHEVLRKTFEDPKYMHYKIDLSKKGTQLLEEKGVLSAMTISFANHSQLKKSHTHLPKNHPLRESSQKLNPGKAKGEALRNFWLDVFEQEAWKDAEFAINAAGSKRLGQPLRHGMPQAFYHGVYTAQSEGRQIQVGVMKPI